MESASENVAKEEPQAGTRGASATDTAVSGLFAGVLGGITVAVFFLIVDLIQGQPLYTPSLLGSALFLGRTAADVQSVHIPMVFAYTGVHMAAFVAIGMAASYMIAEFTRNPPFGLLLLLLFVCLEAGFLAATAALMPGVVGALGAGLILAANLLSAVVMAVFLLRFSHPGALRGLDRIWED